MKKTQMTKLLSFVALASIHTLSIADVSSLDSLFPKQWALKNSGQIIYVQDSDLTREKVIGLPGVDINFLDTSKIASSKQELIVAVLDSGIDLTHPDLKDRIWYNKKLCENAPNAKNLPCNGYNFLENNTSILDDIGHGTHVAGIIAANKNNIGIMGAADPRVKIMPLKVLNNSVNGFVYNGKLVTDVIADAMVFAIKNGAEVINLSLGWPKIIDTPKVRSAFKMAEDNNIIVIAASGNNNKDLPTFPCSYESVICVGAHDNQGRLTEFSNHGAIVDIAAPGEYIISTYPSNLESRILRIKNYEAKRGSSQAAPFVTASIATLKLLNPGLTNNEVRSLLFSSTSSSNNTDKRKVKFGILDQKKLLDSVQNEKHVFVNPLLKNITEVKYKVQDKRFQFSVPLKNISTLPFAGNICLKALSEAISLDVECVNEQGILGGDIFEFKISGAMKDLSLDSKINFELTLGESKYPFSIFFTRDLNNDSELLSLPISGGNFEEMAVMSNGRKLSRMMKVMDKLQNVGFPEYLFLEKNKQTDLITNVSLLTKINNAYIVKNISLPKVNKVLSIHRQDINLDGRLDYIVYALSSNKTSLQLFTFDQDLLPLFGNNSIWNWDLSTFEGLPIENGTEKFDWVKIKTADFGKILVPSITRVYEMPEEDNSKNILDRVVGRSNHQFYLLPLIENGSVKIKLRVLDSILTLKRIKNELKLNDASRLDLIKTIPQSNSFYQNGLARLFFRVSNGEEISYIEVVTSSDSLSVNKIDSVLPLDGSAIYSFYDLEKSNFSDSNLFTSLINRSRANFVLRDNSGIRDAKDLINSWDNLIISLISAYQDQTNSYFLVENRYTISFSDQLGTFKYELPIYRDSSFPGQNFSETMTPILSNGRPGVYVNSTLVFGERIYSMIGSKSGLIRPLNLSVNIPDGCIPLNSELMGDKSTSNFLFLCTDQSRQLSLKYLPMSMN